MPVTNPETSPSQEKNNSSILDRSKIVLDNTLSTIIDKIPPKVIVGIFFGIMGVLHIYDKTLDKSEDIKDRLFKR